MTVIRGIVFSALFAALFYVSSFARVHIPISTVPVVLENLVPMLAGALLGATYGFFSMFLVFILAVLGVPILGGSGGPGVVFGVTGGYILAWPLSAWLVGFVLSRVSRQGKPSIVATFAVVILCGALAPYILAVPWLAAMTHMSFAKAMVAGCYPFLPGDIAKAVVAALVAVLVRQVFPMGLLCARKGVLKLDANESGV